MFLQIVFIAIVAILSCGYIFFCYRRFKQQKIIEGGMRNNKLRMFWIGICIIVGAVLGGVIYGLSLLFTTTTQLETVITNQSTTGTNTQNNQNEGSLFVGSGAILSGGAEDTGEIVSRTTIREKLKHVPVSEKRGTSAQ